MELSREVIDIEVIIMADKIHQPAFPSSIAKDRKVSVCISMNRSDHRRLKMYAASIGKSVSGVIKDWVDQYCVEKEDR